MVEPVELAGPPVELSVRLIVQPKGKMPTLLDNGDARAQRIGEVPTADAVCPGHVIVVRSFAVYTEKEQVPWRDFASVPELRLLSVTIWTELLVENG